MAALVAAFNNILNTLGFDQPARVAITAQVSTADELREYTKKDITDQIARNIREPGGTVPNPQFDPANPVAPQVLRNHGVSFSVTQTRTLEQLRFYAHHRHYQLSLPMPPPNQVTKPY